MPATPIYIVCSPRPQVGKTLVARLLTEFLLLKNGRVTAFDINLKEPSLLDYLPDLVETADISDTYGKMELMDRVIATRAKAEGRAPADIIKANYTDVAAMRKWVDPEEVAEAALFLASDASSAITAEHIKVDAGRM